MDPRHGWARPTLYVGLLALLVSLLAACSSPAPAGTGAAPRGAAPSTDSKASDSGSGYPKQPLEIVVSGAAGGGVDQLGRGVEEALTKEKLWPQTMTVTYYDGGAGTVAMAYIAEKKGSGYHQVVNSNRVYIQKMLDRTPLGVDDFTPIARLASDFEVIAVRKDSPYKTLKEMMDALKKDPKSVSIGNGLAPNDDQIMVLRAAKAQGIDITKLNMVSFSAGGAVMTNLLGGHVDAIATGQSESTPQFKSGDIRILAISSPERLKGDLQDIPTFKEQGIDVVLYHWRGVYGPKDMPKDAKDFWFSTYQKMSKSATWQQILDRYGWSDSLLVGDDFTKDLKEEEKITAELLGPLGILPTKK